MRKATGAAVSNACWRRFLLGERGHKVESGVLEMFHAPRLGAMLRNPALKVLRRRLKP